MKFSSQRGHSCRVTFKIRVRVYFSHSWIAQRNVSLLDRSVALKKQKKNKQKNKQTNYFIAVRKRYGVNPSSSVEKYHLSWNM